MHTLVIVFYPAVRQIAREGREWEGAWGGIGGRRTLRRLEPRSFAISFQGVGSSKASLQNISLLVVSSSTI